MRRATCLSLRRASSARLDAHVKHFHGAHFSAHAVAGERQAVCIVDQSVQDGICEGGISDHLEPLIDRQLAGQDGRATNLAVIEDFKQVATLGRCQN